MPIRYVSVFESNGSLAADFPHNAFPHESKELQDIASEAAKRGECIKRTFEVTDGKYHYQSQGEGHIVGCYATKDVPDRLVWAFLEKCAEAARGQTQMHAMKRLLEQTLKKYNNPATCGDKIIEVQTAIDGAKKVMEINLAAVFVRGDNLAAIEAKTEVMVNNAKVFDAKATELKRHMCLRHVKLMATVGGAILVLILVVLMVICKPNFKDCS